MSNFINRIFFATVYPGVWLIYSIVLSVITFAAETPIKNLWNYLQDNPIENFSNGQIFILIAILVGLICFLIIKIYVFIKICYLSCVGWKKYGEINK